ncbi:MAG: nitroreductase [Planctomycetota bacterium]|nr:nitroreductase [Planctomycetota bacterium]
MNSGGDDKTTIPTIEEVIRGRRTVHNFAAELPPFEQIEKAVELARWAPNHRHTEPWRFHHLGPESISAVVDLNAKLVAEKKGAAAGEAKRERWSMIPGWLVVTSVLSPDDSELEKEDYAACCCAIQNLSLYLWSVGIGVKWTTGAVTRHPDFYRLLSVDPAERQTVGVLWYGYAANVAPQKRQPVEEILTRLP